jgi:hypothetical protein
MSKGDVQTGVLNSICPVLITLTLKQVKQSHSSQIKLYLHNGSVHYDNWTICRSQFESRWGDILN